MTDPGAPPLNPNLQKLEAVLRGIEERTPRECPAVCAGGHSTHCDKAHVKRVRSNLAHAVARIGQTLIEQVGEFGFTPGSIYEAWAAALRAGEGET